MGSYIHEAIIVSITNDESASVIYDKVKAIIMEIEPNLLNYLTLPMKGGNSFVSFGILPSGYGYVPGSKEDMARNKITQLLDYEGVDFVRTRFGIDMATRAKVIESSTDFLGA